VVCSTIARRTRVLAALSGALAPPLLGALALVAALLGIAAAPAGAVVIEPKAGERFGMQTRQQVLHPETEKVHPLQFHGGPVIEASDTYAVYWDPVGSYRSDWLTLIDRYFHDVGAASGQLSNVFSLNGQYTGPKKTRAAYNSTFRGAYTDTDPYPTSGNCKEPEGEPVCLTDTQIQAELRQFIKANGLPTGVDVIYFVLTPPGVTVCIDGGEKGNCSDSTSTVSPNGICGYHSAIEPTSANPVVYGVQPWIAGDAGRIMSELPLKTAAPNAAVLACQNGTELVEPNQTGTRSPYDDFETGLADLIINDLSIEQSNIVVNPLLTGWYQEGTRAEQSDACQGVFSPAPEELPKVPETTHALSLTNETISGDHYYLQWAFSSTGVTSGKGVVCWEGTELNPHFTATNPVKPGDVVAFDANESGMSLDANLANVVADEPFEAPIYKWSFGDGSAVVSGTQYASVFHSYANEGEYEVTLTITDSGGNVASFTKPIKVLSLLPPVGPSGSSGGAAPQTSATSTQGGSRSGSSSGKGSSAASPAPKLTESIPTRSLHKALRHGLQIHYRVNEQVAGTVEVLLPTTIAKRLHIRGTVVSLPKGHPRSVVIGYAVLVTTKAGHGTLQILIPAAVAQRLAGLHKVKLTVRFQVHGTGRHPKVTTTLTTVVLKG
jgi:PKD domain-containing protein